MDEAKAWEIRQWMIKADHDLRSARRLFEGEDSGTLAMFLTLK
jgi:hypothetical protein